MASRGFSLVGFTSDRCQGGPEAPCADNEVLSQKGEDRTMTKTVLCVTSSFGQTRPVFGLLPDWIGRDLRRQPTGELTTAEQPALVRQKHAGCRRTDAFVRFCEQICRLYRCRTGAPDANVGRVHDRPAYIVFHAQKTSRPLDKAMSRALDLHCHNMQRFMRPVPFERHKSLKSLESSATLQPRRGKALTLADAPPCL